MHPSTIAHVWEELGGLHQPDIKHGTIFPDATFLEGAPLGPGGRQEIDQDLLARKAERGRQSALRIGPKGNT